MNDALIVIKTLFELVFGFIIVPIAAVFIFYILSSIVIHFTGRKS